jgi:hypothetical protein
LFQIAKESSDETVRREAIAKLRQQSRFEYLSKREKDKLDELESDIMDEDRIFAGEKFVCLFIY